MNDIKIAEAAKRLIDAKYRLGPGEEVAFDCLSMLWEFYGNLDIHLPDDFKGFSVENYAERWKKGEGRSSMSISYLSGKRCQRTTKGLGT